MAKKTLLVCEKCGESSEVKVGKSLLGFPRWNCPKCKTENIYPLGSGYRNGYTILVALGVLLFFVAVSSGRSYTPGIILIAAIIALYKDNKMRSKLKDKNVPKEKNVDNRLENSVADSIYCSECGTKYEKDGKFCPNCGIKNQA